MPIPFACPYCGHPTMVLEQYIGQTGPCAACGRQVTVTMGGIPTQEPLSENAGIRLLLPIGRSPWAIAAGYMGLFSIALIPAPLAIILGIIAIIDIKNHPKKHGLGRAIFGLVIGVLFSILLVYLISSLPRM